MLPTLKMRPPAVAVWMIVLVSGAIHVAVPRGAEFAAGAVRPADSQVPQSAGCITHKPAGDHMFMCGEIRVDARVPASCPAAGCGLILSLHGDTGTGLLEDEHLNLRARGVAHGYIVVAPTGARMRAWSRANDQAIVEIVRQFQQVFDVDRRRVHVTGFSRGGFVTWRLVCDHADLFASAAPAGASDGSDRGEVTCFSGGRVPARNVPLLLLIGRTDEAVGYPLMIAIRDAALSRYRATAATVLTRTQAFTHTRWTSRDGAVVEAFEHSYETDPAGPWGWARGHCFPGSTVNPRAPQYAVACAPPNAFTWGEEVVRFFDAHPMS